MIIAILVFVIVFYGYYKKIDVYSTFIDGSKEAFNVILTMFTSLLAMMFAINIILNSNFINYFSNFFKFIFDIPFEVIPMIILRPISSSSSLSILDSIFPPINTNIIQHTLLILNIKIRTTFVIRFLLHLLYFQDFH